MQKHMVSRIALDPSKCDGHTFRYTLDGGGVMQLYFGGVHRSNVLTRSHFGHQSEPRARAWSVASGVDWIAQKKLSNRIQYHLRRRLAVARAGSCAVLLQAYELAQVGYALKVAATSPANYDYAITQVLRPIAARKPVG